MIGEHFGRWTVTSEAPRKHGKLASHCICDCGTRRVVMTDSLISGKSRSCGCLARELRKDREAADRQRDKHRERKARTWTDDECPMWSVPASALRLAQQPWGKQA